MKHTPLRTCLVTREKLPKAQLLRVVKTKDDTIIFDPTGKMNGRGAYIKKDIDVIKKAQQKKIISRHFDTNIPTEFYVLLEERCHD
jgi:predicted RNA-binding protein YlxR (DUF448 family)